MYIVLFTPSFGGKHRLSFLTVRASAWNQLYQNFVSLWVQETEL